MQRLELRDISGIHRPPRIALIIERFDARRGGAESYTRDLAIWLAAAGGDVHVLARHVGDAERALPLSFHSLGPAKGLTSFAAAVRERLAALRPDISHDMGVAVDCDVFQSHVGSPTACQRAADMAHSPAIRLLRRVVQEFPRRCRIRRLAAHQFGGLSAVFLAVSKRVADDLMHLHAVPTDRIRVVYNGVDAERFHPRRQGNAGALIRQQHGIGPDDVLVIAVANNHRLKGIHVLVRAIRRLRREGLPIKALVCGGATAGRPRRDDGVIYAGHVTDTAAHYAAADIAAQPSFYDACSLTTLEALASGLPVITTRGNGAGELITHGVDGLVLDNTRDERPLAAALGWLATDRWHRAQLAHAGRALALNHSVDRAFGGVVAAYAEVVAGRGACLVYEPATPRGYRIAA